MDDFAASQNAVVTKPEFCVGQLVSVKAAPERMGPVIEVLSASGSRSRFRVFHSASETREYYAEQIVLVAPCLIAPLFQADQRLTAEEFHARLTALRLAHPLTDNLYALHAARVQFIPFQFKPLLRLLRSDRPRLLVADEVGVGKTIEAGLILRELQSRQRLENVIIVCPKALVAKWRSEMKRFDEDFQPLNAGSLRYCLQEAHLDGAWPSKYARAIVHLELLRNPDYLFGTEGRNARPGLGTLDPPAQFSLAVFDEAHHLRNAGTNSHQLARFICDNSEAAIFLSATPVHLRSRNLFTLLNLLRPDLFQSEPVFQEMVEPNRFLNQAIRHVRAQQPSASWTRDAIGMLAAASATSWGARTLANDPRFQDCLALLQSVIPPTDAARIRCLRDLEDLHTLAHVMNRTRRRDIGRFTTREPHTVSVPFTPAQADFYEALIAFRTEILLLHYDPAVIRLIVDMLERQAASCLPALVPMLDTFIETGRFSAARLTDAWEQEDDDFELPAALRQQAEALRRLGQQLPADDPKLAALFEIARACSDGHGPGKLLVFSYFIHTLRYLERHLRAAGFRVGLITGQTPDELDDPRGFASPEPTRGQLRDRFRKPSSDSEALDILLSSEVGCEGLDYEFCDRLVNYDIPWNPMRLEQRIGRIDRFGQQSEKVCIFNFVTPGTVEERIFFRCFERLGIFRDTVGDCEEVLGELSVTEALLEIARNPQLTPEQAEARARQIADNAHRLVEERSRLEKESSGLLGLDQALTDETLSVEAQGRFVSSEELRAMIQFFLLRPELSGQLEPDRERAGHFRLRLKKEARSTLLAKIRSWQPSDRSLVTFRRWLEGADPFFLVTFDQAAALQYRELPFITPVHPLAKLATQGLLGGSHPLTASLRLCTTDVPSGRYVFACDLWETIAVRPEIRLLPFAWDLHAQTEAPAISAQLLRLLGAAQTAGAFALPDHIIQHALAQIEECIHQQHSAALAELARSNARLVDLKLASLEAYHGNRVSRIQSDLASVGEERIRRMKTAELARAHRDRDARSAEIARRRQGDIIRERVALGLLEIHHE